MNNNKQKACIDHGHSQNHSPRSKPILSQNLPDSTRSAGNRIFSVFTLLALVFSIPAHADIVYSQAPLGSSTSNSFVTAYAGGTDSDQWTYDHFISAQSGSISNINWQGTLQAVGSSYDTSNGFVITILNAQPVTPDTTAQNSVVASINVPGNANQTHNANGLYDFQANLATPFNIMAGLDYWVTIYATDAKPYASWGWGNGTGGPGTAITYTTGQKQWLNVAGGHRAFTLNGTVLSHVPLPPALWLFASAMGCLGFIGRRPTT